MQCSTQYTENFNSNRKKFDFKYWKLQLLVSDVLDVSANVA